MIFFKISVTIINYFNFTPGNKYNVVSVYKKIYEVSYGSFP